VSARLHRRGAASNRITQSRNRSCWSRLRAGLWVERTARRLAIVNGWECPGLPFTFRHLAGLPDGLSDLSPIGGPFAGLVWFRKDRRPVAIGMRIGLVGAREVAAAYGLDVIDAGLVLFVRPGEGMS
jgi:hypothetical protein